MNSPTETRSEKYLRFSRRGMMVTLFLVLVAGGAGIAMAIWPGASGWSDARRPLHLVAIVLIFWLYRTLGGERWDPRTPEARAIVEDEWRLRNMDRARRVAFIVVLGAQVPLGLLLASLPPLRAVMGMAAATVTLGMATLLALFLYFDRDAADV